MHQREKNCTNVKKPGEARRQGIFQEIGLHYGTGLFLNADRPEEAPFLELYRAVYRSNAVHVNIYTEECKRAVYGTHEAMRAYYRSYRSQ